MVSIIIEIIIIETEIELELIIIIIIIIFILKGCSRNRSNPGHSGQYLDSGSSPASTCSERIVHIHCKEKYTYGARGPGSVSFKLAKFF